MPEAIWIAATGMGRAAAILRVKIKSHFYFHLAYGSTNNINAVNNRQNLVL
jgi:hypothetical protein